MSLEAAERVVFNKAGGESEPIWLAGCLYDIRLSSEHTDGHMSATIITSPGSNVIAPPHQHYDADEFIYVLNGLLVVNIYHGDVDDPEEQLDPDKYVAHTLYTHDFIWMPAGTIEALHTTGNPMTALFLFTPAGGSDEFFRTAGDPAKYREVPSGQIYQRPSVDVLRSLSEETKFQFIPQSREADGESA